MPTGPKKPIKKGLPRLYGLNFPGSVRCVSFGFKACKINNASTKIPSLASSFVDVRPDSK